MALTDPASLPTLADLPASDAQSKYKPDASINKRVSIWRGDITKLEADMIVNAANKSLLGGGGVDGAIHRAAGPGLLRECRTLGGARTGEVKVTDGYDLPSKRVAHAVGPIYYEDEADLCAEQLQSCYARALEQCATHGGGSIGFSSISTGIYGYPIEDATRIALETTRKFLQEDKTVSGNCWRR
ncbi:hypothetical protein VHUM_03229 [Vanrija humicola]|uniref:Macro domain-containing protein n=1 Tax=Vanrija humicola TaxID=5417 RepID=A0A7D8V0S3_VANHU|nr:hypothetical protein VHUM_03229 [Vanrija humicola]